MVSQASENPNKPILFNHGSMVLMCGRYLQYAAALFCLIVAAIYLTKYAVAMATTSMWNDELYSIRHFSQQGIFTAWTDYHVPNNHILFNMLASFVPSSLAYAPFWARLISFIAVFGALAFFLVFVVKERLLAGGALALGLLCLNSSTLDLVLQARGYGIVFAAGLVQSIFLYRFLKNGNAVDRNWFLASAFVGGATLPIYLPFAAIQCVLAFVLKPSWRFVVAGAVTGIVGIIFYLPVAEQILSAASSYAEIWGKHYASIGAVTKSLEFIFVFNSKLFWLIGVTCAFGAVALIAKGWTSKLQTVLVCLVSIVGFFAICLILETPLVRTTQFIVGPIAVTLALLVSEKLKLPQLATIQALATGAVFIWLGSIGIQRVQSWSFEPIEAWSEVADFTELLTSDQVQFHAPFRSWQLAVHLDDPGRIVTEFNETAFRSGSMISIDGDIRVKDLFSGESVTDKAIDFDVRQRRGERMRISLVPIRTHAIKTIAFQNLNPARAASALDDKPETRWTSGKLQTDLPDAAQIRISFEEERSCTKFFWYGRNGDIPESFDAFVSLNDGRRFAIDHRASVLSQDLLMVDLKGLHVESLEFHVEPKSKQKYLSINEAWCGY